MCPFHLQELSARPTRQENSGQIEWSDMDEAGHLQDSLGSGGSEEGELSVDHQVLFMALYK